MTDDPRHYAALVELDPGDSTGDAVQGVSGSVWSSIADFGVLIERAEIIAGESDDGQLLRDPQLRIELYGTSEQVESLPNLLDAIPGVVGTWISEIGSDDVELELGKTVAMARRERGLTAEQAAKRAGLAYKTWLRIESGKPVRNQSWAGVDQLFGLKDGTALRIKSADLAGSPRQVAANLRDAIKGAHVTAVREATNRKFDLVNGSSARSSTFTDSYASMTVEEIATLAAGLSEADLLRLRDLITGMFVGRIRHRIDAYGEELDQGYAELRKVEASGADPEEIREARNDLEHASRIRAEAKQMLDGFLSKQSHTRGDDDGER